MTEFLRIHNATVVRDDVTVFERLSLSLDIGVHTVILGPNGAGKSTLLKLITREVYPQARDESFLRVFGVTDWNVWELRARLGMVSHDLQLQYLAGATGRGVVLSGFYSSLGVWEHHDFSAQQLERAEVLLERLDVAHLRDRRYGQLSTGEQRRLLLARALVHEPEVLILDEPTSGLDLKSCFAYLERVRALMNAGTTVVLVTHHVHEIAPEVARVVCLNGGRISADGAKANVLSDARLTQLFDTPIRLVCDNGWYQALPGARPPG